nr:hypothetical protein [Vibrio sp. J502]
MLKLKAKSNALKANSITKGFVAKAPEAVVAIERQKLNGYQDTLVKLEEQKSDHSRAIIAIALPLKRSV